MNRRLFFKNLAIGIMAQAASLYSPTSLKQPPLPKQPKLLIYVQNNNGKFECVHHSDDESFDKLRQLPSNEYWFDGEFSFSYDKDVVCLQTTDIKWDNNGPAS